MSEAKPLNYTTSIAVGQTASECQAILAAAGASAVSVEYEAGQPAGLWFRLDIPHGRRNFALPVDIGAMRRVLEQAERDGMFAAARQARGRYSTPEHAARVAWRVVKDWLEANLALMRAQMASLDQIMLPYLMMDDEHTLYQRYRESEQAGLAILDG